MKFSPALLLCALAAFAAPAFSQTYSFSILAGAPPPTGTRDGIGADARFNTPIGIAVDSGGNLYVADRGNSVIRKVSPGGATTTVAGLAGVAGTADGIGAAARFDQPTGLALDPAGNVYVTDRAQHTIRKITPAGVVSTLAGLAGTAGSTDGAAAAARFRTPFGIAVDAEGNVYVSEAGNRVIRKITSAGVVTTLAGLAGVSGNTDGAGANARFNSPGGVALDAAGNLYVVDANSHVVRKITPAGVVSTLAGFAGSPGIANGTGTVARFNNPLGIAAEPNGTLYVADTVNETIRRIATDGTVTTFAGSAVAGNTNGTGGGARFFRPQGVAVDAGGNVYVTDTANHSIRKLTPGAVSSTLAGGGGNFGSTDGDGANAMFNRPRGLGIDSEGNLYVAESFNSTVRKITPAGAVSTFAGTAGAPGYVDAAGSAARFGYPYGIAVDSTDSVYVADAVNNTIRKISSGGLVRTLAGTPSTTPGISDGPFNVGRMNFPQGVAVDRDGNTYIADSSNHTIRKANPAGDLTTLAGLAGVSGSADGAGAAARFSGPAGLAVDAAGNVFVADFGNSTIRKITPGGVVSTLAGLAGSNGSVDGSGSVARFDNPEGIVIDAGGNLFVSDTNNHTIRRITPDGTVTTLGGMAGVSGVAGGSGDSARFFIPSGIALDRTGALYVVSAFGNVVMKGELSTLPVITTQPQSQSVFAGTPVTFAVAATGGGLGYQWKFNGATIPGATNSNYTISAPTVTSAGSYTVEVTNASGSRTSNAATLAVMPASAEAGRITNLAIRSQAGTGAQTLIVGVSIGGAGTSGVKPLLLRGVGPALGAFGVTGALNDPKLELFSATGAKLSENDDWAGNATISTIAAQVGAFAFSPSASKDAALYDPASNSGGYTVWITGNGGATGVALAEIYDATPASGLTATTPRLTNVSARTQVGTGGDILIAGFVIGGQTSKTVLIRAVGPTLGSFGVPGALTNPRLELFHDTAKINENDDWGGSAALANAFQSVGAFALSPSSLDAALLVQLAPGNYTAQVSGVGGTTGVGLVEVYELP